MASLDDQLQALPGVRSIFYGTDDFAASAELVGVNGRWLERAERRQLRKADLVVAVSEVLRDKWAAQRPDGIEVIWNGCDTEHFANVDQAPEPSDVRLVPPIAGFVGHLSERIDLTLLEAVAEHEISLLVVGPRQPTFEMARIEKLFARPNVQWVGKKSFEDLPSYLRMIDAGLTPYARSAFNRASFPLKTLEYLAAGRPAIASDLPATRMLDTDLIAVTDTPRGFVLATQRALTQPRTAAAVATRRAFAEQHSWTRRADDFARLLGVLSVNAVDDGR